MSPSSPARDDRGRDKSRPYSIVALLLAVLPVSALAQPATQPAPATPAGDGAIAGKESNHGVYVRDSAIAVDKFALAGRMEKLKEWNKAADALQEILEKNADRVVPSQVDAKNVIYQYTSVTTAVQERLAKWPAEGLDVYRARFEPSAVAMLANAAPEDVAALHRAYALYFVTDTGKAAGLRLVDLYMESGEFPAAAWLAERMLGWHPSIEAERPRLLYRAALAQHLSGDAKSAAARLATLKENFADAKGLVRGQEVALAESLAQELSAAPPVARGASGDSWPMLGGSPDRGRIPEAGGRIGALINFIDYVRPARTRMTGAAAADPSAVPVPGMNAPAAVIDGRRIEGRPRDDGMTLGVLPAVDRGEMFFQDNARIYAVSLESGVVLPGWAATYGDRGGQYVAPNAAQPLPRNQQMTVTVTDSSVLAITGQIDVQLAAQGMIVGDRDTRLVCLDRVTGKERWTATARQLPDAAAQLRTLALGGSPLVVGDNVYVLGRGGKPTQFEDAYVLCYALKDGSYRWSCYIASGNADPNAMQGMGVMGADNVAQLAYASGRLYALTNLGALASIDAYSGTIVWLNIYPRPKPDFMDVAARWNRSNVPPPQQKPWMQNPVIVKDGKVFILPTDAQHVLIYDAGSGVEVKRIRTSDFDAAKTLLAVAGERMLMCSDNSVFCINWQTYDPKHPDRESNLIWHAPFGRQGYSKPSDVIRGRGFVTTDSVFIPTGWALFRLSLKGGRTEQIYPRDREWDQGEGPGNVLVTRDHVILATAERVNVYTDLAVAQAKLDAEVAAAPNDPEPRLRYAEMMFVSNQLDIAADKLDEAMALLKPNGASVMRSGAQRDRVFNIALTFAQKLSDPAAGSEEDRKLAVELFDRAGVAADSPAQQVIYRMTRARFSAAEPAEQVRLYQEILADERLRPVPYTSEEGGGGQSQAAAVAEGRIGTIIKTVGRGPYAAFDEKAGDALAAARTGTEPRALMDVATVYPNARVAPEAMLAAAEAFEAANNPRGATQVLNQVLRKYPTTYPPAHIVEAQVRNYLKLPNGVGVAIGKLNPALDKAVLSRPIELPDGSTLAKAPLKAVREALYVHNARLANEALPEFALPDPTTTPREPGQPFKTFLPEKPDSLIPDVDRLVVPQREFANHDRIVTWTAGKGIAIYAVGRTTPIGSTVEFSDTPRGAAWIDGNVLVWGPTKTMLLAGETGARVWETVVRGLAPLDVAPPGEVVVDASTPAIEGDNNNLVIRNRAMIRARGGFGGNVQIIGGVVQPVIPHQAQPQAQAVPGEVIEHVRPAGDRVVLSTTAGRVLAIELAGGKVAWQARLAEGPILQLLANDDFAVARFADASGSHIVALDPYSGQSTGPRRLFPANAPDPSRHPVNMALSPEGTLVFTTQTQLCGINLFDAKELAFQVPPAPDSVPRYAGANAPNQLVVANGRILTIANNGSYLYVHSLDNGKQLPGQFPTHARDWGVHLRTVASRVYVVTQRRITAYNLDRVEDMWPGSWVMNLNPAPVVRDAMIGRDYVVLLDQLTGEPQPALAGNPGAAPAAAPPAPAPRQGFRLIGFSRAQTSRGPASIESGRFDHHPTITSPAGISEEWQGVNGGFYYRTLDRTVHFLRGARPTAAG